MPYQNARLTRAVDTPGELTIPSIRWKKRLGGQDTPAMVQDVTGNGQADVLNLTGGRALCRNPVDGAIVWSSQGLALGAFLVDSDGKARDLDGDGIIDVLVGKKAVGDTRIYALDGRTGKIQWSFGEGLGPNSGVNGGNQHWIGNLDGDPEPELVLWVPSNDAGAVLYAFDFSDGFGAEVLQWTSGEVGYNGRNVFSVVSVPGASAPRIVISSAEVLHIIDGSTGVIQASISDWYGEAADVPYGARLTPVNTGDSGGVSLFSQASFGALGGFAGIWRYDAEAGLSMSWRFDATSPMRGARPVDLDGDGLDEVVLSVFEEERWSTRVLSGVDGHEITRVADLVLANGQGDVSGDGVVDLALIWAPDEVVPSVSVVRVMQLVGETLEFLWLGGVPRAELAGVVDRDGDGQAEVVVYRDADDDGVRDSLQVLQGGSAEPVVIVETDFAKGRDVIFKGFVGEAVGSEPGQALVFVADGFLEVWGGSFNPLGARLQTGGYAPGLLATAGGAWLQDSTGRTIRIDLAAGAPDKEPPASTIHAAGSGRQVLLFTDVDHDGQTERMDVQTDGERWQYHLVNADGTTRWTFEPEGATWGLETPPGTGGDLDGDTVDDFYLQTAIASLRKGIPVSGATGEPLDWSWQPFQTGGSFGTSYTPALFHDFDGDGLSDIMIARYQDRIAGINSEKSDPVAPLRVMSGLTGTTLATSNYSLDPCRPVLAQLDDTTDTVDVLMSWWRGRGGLSLTVGASEFTSLWWLPPEGALTRGMPHVADIDGDGADDMVHLDHSLARVRAHRGYDGEPLWAGERILALGRSWIPLEDGTFEDAQSGDLLPKLPPNALLEGGVMATNLTGTGRPSVLFGGTDGIVYAVNATDGSLDWSLDLGFAIGAVVAADTDDDGLLEVLVTAEDGHLYAIGQAADVGDIGEVRDGKGSDVDAVLNAADGISPKGFSANWEPAVGGAEAVLGYYVRLLTETGALALDWQDVGNVTSFDFAGYVTLAPAVTYRVVVMPYGSSGAGRVFRSDGFWFLDDDGDGLLLGDEQLLGTNPYQADSDGDGISDGVETDGGKPINTDGDQWIDALDTDSDDDGLLDLAEGVNDTDDDQIPDYRDTDDDNDGLPTQIEVADGVQFSEDADNDGLLNWYDTDSDADGRPDGQEGTADDDNDGWPNYLDPVDDPPDDPPPGETPPGEVLVGGENVSRSVDGCTAAPTSGSGVAHLILLLGMLALLLRTSALRRR